jgi:asparaginyl-tRNA synthetase
MTKKITPPKSWKNLSTHHQVALKNPWYRLLTHLQDEFNYATTVFYRKKGFRSVQLPITTGSISSPMGLGSDSLPVKVNIAGLDTYLADSMQFFLEYVCRINKEGSYYIAPSFRGEPVDNRHLSQFYHSEAEIIGTLDDVIKLCQEYLIFLSGHLLSSSEEGILSATQDIKHLKHFIKNGRNIPRCSFDEAVDLLENNPKYIEKHDLYRNINQKGEQELMKHFGGYVWLTNFDHLAVPFYQKYAIGTNHQKTINADLLMGVGEIIGSGERHLTGQEVKKALSLHKVKKISYDWYIKLKDEIPLQTSGFGLGVERFFLWVLKHDDIRDIQILPRFNGIPSVF